MTEPAALVAALSRSGQLTDRRWRDAMLAVPREHFIPPVAVAVSADTTRRYPIDRHAAPDVWRQAVYSDTAIVTQLDDGDTPLTTGDGDSTSSASAPGMVAAFLELLAPLPGDHVLEIGTGTGWTAALLATRLGADRVTSVEIDADVAARAAANLRSAGSAPELIVADGAAGWPGGEPYDGVHVTCGVRDIPHAWVTQTRPGGTLVLPWLPGIGHGHRLWLTGTGDGRAVGRLAGGCSYMMLRAQRPVAPDFAADGEWRESSTLLDPRRVLDGPPGAHVAVAGQLPGVFGHGADGPDGRYQAWLWSADSQARVAYDPDYLRCGVEQRGPRDLWDEAERAYLTWVGWGRPERERFGVTVDAAGQRVWLDTPGNALPESAR
ncbi:methyltransferase domain-containing protein [Marinactinospora rubrisoli]|uniref:Protein-L-isoaspartate O-methyltransferase n=1 Tax=Marinactinospora rubrisoli TaxID=2715399 RepID=A0ABW2KL21_9ACTN